MGGKLPQVYVAEPGYILTKGGLPKHAIITAVNKRVGVLARVLGGGGR